MGKSASDMGTVPSTTVLGREEESVKAEGAGEKPSGVLVDRAAAMKVPVLKEVPKNVGKDVLSFLSKAVAERYRMAVYGREGNLIRIAMSRPEDIEAMNALRFLSEKEQMEVEVSLASDEVIDGLLEQYASTDEALQQAILSMKDGKTGVELKSDADIVSDDKKGATEEGILQDAPIARLLESIIKHAIESRASDIHIEPAEENYRIRFRVDGILHSSLVFPLPVGRAVIARIKILANLKIDERRKPQDGRFRAEHGGESVDLRVSTFPVVDGEKVVMRILEKSQGLVDFDEMGLWGKIGELLLQKIREPYGIILMTGPTGSGKSTTLYSFLRVLNQEQRNIVTLEDPVEYSIAGVNQSQVNPEIGYTFANGLRSILRQDPNVIMVGEIRDGETAELAIHAALTGHLVLSTLHTNSALGAIPRLVDMGIEPFLIASALQVVAAQRLVRRICPRCKEEVELTPELRQRIEIVIEGIDPRELKRYGYDHRDGIHLFQGKGCEACGNSGYKGRIAIYEAFEVNDQVTNIIGDGGGSETRLGAEAKRQGMLTMREDGILKALRGLTTLTEIERVTEGKVLVDEE